MQADLRTLAQAIRKNDVRVIREYLTRGGNPNAADDRGCTLLHEAVHFGRAAVVKLLLDAGARPNARDRDQVRPLNLALEGASEPLRLIVGPSGVLVYRRAPASASSRARAGIVRLLLEAGAEVNPKKARSGVTQGAYYGYQTPLAQASEAGRASLVRLLLEHGADPNGEDYFGSTPLLEAVNAGNLEAARVLLGAGARANPRPDGRDTPVMRAIYAASTAVHDAQKPGGVGGRARDAEAARAIEERFAAILDLLLKAGADVNASDDRGQNALWACVNEGRDDLLRKVLAAGADLAHRDAEGDSVLHFLVKVQRSRQLAEATMAVLAKTLLEAGADGSAADRRGMTAEALAREVRSSTLAEALSVPRRE